MRKFSPTHEIIVPGPESRLTIPVMLDQGDLWQRSEYDRRAPFPMWRLVDGNLEYRHGVMPNGATVEEIVMCLQCGQPLHYDEPLTFIDNSNPGLGGCHARCVDAYHARRRKETP